jgi:hypothetical protein
MRNRSISRILYPDCVGTAIIHLDQPLPVGSSDLPGGRIPTRSGIGRAALLTPPYLVLHCEEFAWPRMSPHAPVRSYIKPENGPHRFTHHLDMSRLVCSLLHLSSSTQRASLGQLSFANAPPLAGSLPCSVRTFLSRLSIRHFRDVSNNRQQPPDLFSCKASGL